MKSNMLIKNGRLLNPATGFDGVCDILIEKNVVKDIGRDISVSPNIQIIDATGLFVFPGFIDLHVHFRDPGQTHKEDIETGSKAATRGGYTSVCTMPNTSPVVDSVDVVKYIIKKGNEVGLVNVLPVASITKGMSGKELNDIESLVEAGACAISEDGKSVMDSGLYREALKIAAKLDIPVLAHCEDAKLVRGGVIHEGVKSKELNLPGITESVEDVIAIRDILLAGEAGARLHLCHNSTRIAADFVRMAKAKGYKVSGEVCPHHFSLTDMDIPSDDANYKMNPPLRDKNAKDSLIEGLRDGTFEAISTDHAPHSAEEKSKGFMGSPFGIVGLETAASLTYTKLVLEKILSPMDMAMRMSYGPARILGIDRGDISPGKEADIVLFDPECEYEIRGEEFAGKSHNMPYQGWKVKGRVAKTIRSGKITFSL